MAFASGFCLYRAKDFSWNLDSKIMLDNPLTSDNNCFLICVAVGIEGKLVWTNKLMVRLEDM